MVLSAPAENGLEHPSQPPLWRLWPSPRGAPKVSFLIPIPPSVNNIFVGSGSSKRRFKGSDYKRWLQDAGWRIKAQHVPPVLGLVAVLIEAPLHRRRDLDNSLKATLDLVVKMGLITDDNMIDDLRIVRTGFGDEARISIWPMEGLA